LLDIDFPPRGSKRKRALLGRFDGARESILVSFNHIPARSVFLRRIHHRCYRWRGQTEKAHAAYKRAIAIAMDDPSAQSASLLGDIGLLYAKFGDQAQAVHYTRMARAEAPRDVQLMYSEGQVYAPLGQPVRAIPAYRPAIAKGYSRKEVWNDPENAKLQSFPEFVKLVKSGTSK
jgi:tetratricopeptide (TPR) repeat protein